MTQKMQPFWYFKKPPAVEKMRNGGFELGDFTYWDTFASTTVVIDTIHSGHYAAKLGYISSVKQTLATPAPQNRIITFSVWIYGHDVLGQHSNAEITIYYSDGSNTVAYFDAPNDAWLEVDLKPYVEVGKTVTGLRIRSWKDLAINLWVDDVSLIDPVEGV
jgi:hypothetical protein